MRQQILDACCGGRMFHYDRKNPLVLYIDNRTASKGHLNIESHNSHEVAPDIVMDFRKMSFPDGSFKLIIFDPPHLLNAGPNSWQAKKYGKLSKDTWREDLKKGFNECWRVLDNGGTLIFKWSDIQIKAKEVMALFAVQPIIGHFSGKSGKTIWCTYYKPELLEGK